MPATVTFEPWSGVMTDPERGEGPEQREGYKFKIKFGKQAVYGRPTVGLVVSTDSPTLPTIRWPFLVQKGIVALPERLYLGEIPQAKLDATATISRPGKPFKIVKTTVDSPFFKVVCLPSKDGWEYKLRATFDGNATIGSLNAMITIDTDDPKQPVVRIPIEAIIK